MELLAIVSTDLPFALPVFIAPCFRTTQFGHRRSSFFHTPSAKGSGFIIPPLTFAPGLTSPYRRLGSPISRWRSNPAFDSDPTARCWRSPVSFVISVLHLSSGSRSGRSTHLVRPSTEFLYANHDEHQPRCARQAAVGVPELLFHIQFRALVLHRTSEFHLSRRSTLLLFYRSRFHRHVLKVLLFQNSVSR